ncbi:unnamed protein product [Polarella glacialis]|uniref:Apple domain-containing protein n=1 Tax=Polarella glacialis TaxID=89957 RepID=A0A813J0Y9_POLGL|nr:unnamed protein product [Polarella glacialis]
MAAVSFVLVFVADRLCGTWATGPPGAFLGGHASDGVDRRTASEATACQHVFEPVGDGTDRACRGSSADDNLQKYYSVHFGVESFWGCQDKCLSEPLCTGFEYNGVAGRCEVWTQQIGATIALPGFNCWRHQCVPISQNVFEPVDGGTDRACRGSRADDNLQKYYTVHLGVQSVGDCQEVCRSTWRDAWKGEPLCTGIEYHKDGATDMDRCEVWTQQIGATEAVPGFDCFRYVSFYPADGGTDRVCRGLTADDRGGPSDFTLHEGVASLSVCKSLCANVCTGIEHSPALGRCEVWTSKILHTRASAGFTCLRFDSYPSTETSTTTVAASGPLGFVDQEGASIQVGGQVRLFAVGSSNTPWQTWPEQLNLMLRRMGYMTPVIAVKHPDSRMQATNAPVCDDNGELSLLETPRIGKVGWSSWGFAFESKDDCGNSKGVWDPLGFRSILGHRVSCTNAWACNPGWCCGVGGQSFIRPSDIAEDAQHSQVTVLSNWINDNKQRHAQNVCFDGEAIDPVASTAITVHNLKLIIDAIHQRNAAVVVAVMALYPDASGPLLVEGTLQLVADINNAVKLGLDGMPNTIFVNYTFPVGERVFQTLHPGHANCRGDKLLAAAIIDSLYREKVLARGLALADPTTCLARADCEALAPECCQHSALCKMDGQGHCLSYGEGAQ